MKKENKEDWEKEEKTHLPPCHKFEINSVDEEGREYEGFCPRCLMTEVEASKNDCYYPEWTKDLLSSERQRLREEIEKMKRLLPKKPEGDVSYDYAMLFVRDETYNQALSDILKLL